MRRAQSRTQDSYLEPPCRQSAIEDRMSRRAIWLLPLALARGFRSITELHADNFDETLAANDALLVHFYADWSKRSEAFRPHLLDISASSLWADRMLHAQSDIGDERGYTSYIEKHGVTKLPTLVYFRKGHPHLYPHEHPLEASAVAAWLDSVASLGDDLSSGQPVLSEVSQMEAQLEAHHKQLRARQLGNEGTESNATESEEGPYPDIGVPVSHSASGTLGLGKVDSDRRPDEDTEEGSGCMDGAGLTDSDFQKLVLDKMSDVFVIFYKPSAAFCSTNGSAYTAFSRQLSSLTNSVKALHMNVELQKSPFVFEDEELPVAMLFPAEDKRPLEMSEELTLDTLNSFAREHCSHLKSATHEGVPAAAEDFAEDPAEDPTDEDSEESKQEL